MATAARATRRGSAAGVGRRGEARSSAKTELENENAPPCLSANNLAPLDSLSQTRYGTDSGSSTLSRGRTSFNAGLEMKL